MKKLSRKNLNLSVGRLGQKVVVQVGDNQVVVGVHLGVEVEVLGVVPVVVPVVEAEVEAVEVAKEESCKIPTPGKEILTETYHS